MNFSTIVLKFALLESIFSKILPVGFSLCTFQLENFLQSSINLKTFFGIAILHEIVDNHLNTFTTPNPTTPTTTITIPTGELKIIFAIICFGIVFY